MVLENITVKDVKTEVAALSRQLRKNESLTQAQLAEILGISRITIQNLERGKNITLDTLLKVFQHFGLLENFDSYIKREKGNSTIKSLY